MSIDVVALQCGDVAAISYIWIHHGKWIAMGASYTAIRPECPRLWSANTPWIWEPAPS